MMYTYVGVLQQNMCLCEEEATQQKGWEINLYRIVLFLHVIQPSASVSGWHDHE